MPATRTTPSLEQQRAETLVALGFTTTQALLLAASRPGGLHVEATEVQRMLERGCTHDTALRILL